MFILGIQGSPRKNGNSHYLLSSFLKQCESHGASTRVIHLPDLDVMPCKELLVCEKKGFCPLKDNMEQVGYAPVKQADAVVLASPVFFYNVSAQAKIFIDRCQMFWGRKYKLGLKDPARFTRKGILLGVAASGGRRLFDGVELTAKYFFDAISADFSGSLTYKKVEDAGDIMARPEVDQDLERAAAQLVEKERQKTRLVFVSRNGQSSLIAQAFSRELTQGRIRVAAAGLQAAGTADKKLVASMAQTGLDIKYTKSLAWETLSGTLEPADQVIYLDIPSVATGDNAPLKQKNLPDALQRATQWEISQAADKGGESVDRIRDQIQQQVRSLSGFV